MGRIIKFRAWQNDPYLDEPIMHDWQSLDRLDEDGFVHLFDILKGEEKYFTPMQFAGLYDKTGKEIYEGDILEWRRYRFEVRFNNGEYYGYPFSNNEIPGDLSCGHFYESEIIGNVFQNPELLND